MSKDWTGNYNSIYKTLGASSHSVGEREENDFYATNPKALELLLEKEEFAHFVYEPAVGQGHLAEVLKNNGYTVICSDIIDRGYPNTEVKDFLTIDSLAVKGDIITNPPYKYAAEFVEKAMQLVDVGDKIAMFLKLQFLEGKDRYKLFKKYPPKKIYVFSSRITCAKNGDFYQRDNNGNIKLDRHGNKLEIGSAVCYAWFIWEKGSKSLPIIDWLINE
jgi:hypothetical protein